MKRIPWNQYFMAQSHLLALRSTCTRLMVGATIVRDKRIIAGGYNGSVSGSEHCIDDGCYMIDGHCVRTIHAEANALLQCAKFGVPTEGSEIYVTHYPCLQCCKQIIQSGIKKVYYAEDYRNHSYAIQLFEEANVETEKVELSSITIDPERERKQEVLQDLFLALDDEKGQSEAVQTLKEEVANIFQLKRE